MRASQLDSKVHATRIFNGHIEAQLDMYHMHARQYRRNLNQANEPAGMIHSHVYKYRSV
jgi:hypothetical protein